MTMIHVLDELRQITGMPNDSKLCQVIDVDPPVILKLRHGHHQNVCLPVLQRMAVNAGTTLAHLAQLWELDQPAPAKRPVVRKGAVS